MREKERGLKFIWAAFQQASAGLKSELDRPKAKRIGPVRLRMDIPRAQIALSPHPLRLPLSLSLSLFPEVASGSRPNPEI